MDIKYKIKLVEILRLRPADLDELSRMVSDFGRMRK